MPWYWVWKWLGSGMFSGLLHPLGTQANSKVGQWQTQSHGSNQPHAALLTNNLLYLNSYCRCQIPARVLPGICLGKCCAVVGSRPGTSSSAGEFANSCVQILLLGLLRCQCPGALLTVLPKAAPATRLCAAPVCCSLLWGWDAVMGVH